MNIKPAREAPHPKPFEVIDGVTRLRLETKWAVWPAPEPRWWVKRHRCLGWLGGLGGK
jgi:hypothetical protein